MQAITSWHLISFAAACLLLLLAIRTFVHGHRARVFNYLGLCLLALSGLAAAPFYNAQLDTFVLQGAQLLLYSLANLLPIAAALLLFAVFEDKDISNPAFWGVAAIAIGLDSYDFWRSLNLNWPNDEILIWIFEYLPQLLKLGFLSLAVFALLKSWRADLVQGRFRLRYITLIIAAIIGTEMLLIENLLGIRYQLPYDPWKFHAAWQLGLALWVFLVFFRLREINWVSFKVVQESASQDADSKPGQSWVDWRVKVEALQHLLEDREIFRDSDLCLADIAHALDIPEYRARQLINGHLGYKNFNVFLNDYRVEAVTRELQDATNSHLPILTIAMDAGYSTLAPFNKAFKERKGITPSEFRKAAASHKK